MRSPNHTTSYTIVGVMPPSFTFPDRETRAWLPFFVPPVTQPGKEGISVSIFQALGWTLSYSVAQRAREIGVRSALGAQVRDIVALVFRQSMAIAGAVLASIVPARRAARVDPITVLRG